MSHKIQFTVNDRTYAWVEKSCKNLGIEKNDFMNLVLRSTKLLGQIDVDLNGGDAPGEVPELPDPIVALPTDPNAPVEPALPADPNAPFDPNAPVDPNAPFDPSLPIQHTRR